MLLILVSIAALALVPTLFPTSANAFIRRWHGIIVRSFVRLASNTYWPLKKFTQGTSYITYVDVNAKSHTRVPIHQVPVKKSGALRFCAVSDTHEVEHLLEIPPCDVLLHCGDVSFQNGDGDGEFYAQRVNEWFGSLKDIQHKVVIGGNHDRFLQSLDMEHKRKLFSHATYLENNSVEITSSGRPIRIHGSPISISGKSQNTGFQYARDSSSGADLIKKVIPESGVDILMTHGMPYGKCDGKTVSHGCKMLAAQVEQLQPLVHVFGHRHQSYSADFSETGNTTYINAASLAASRLPEHPPVVFDLFIK